MSVLFDNFTILFVDFWQKRFVFSFIVLHILTERMGEFFNRYAKDKDRRAT